MKIPNRMFWTTYAGIAAMGLGGCSVGLLFGTALLLFRKFFEPMMPAAFFVVSGLMSRHSHVALRYKPEDYPWIVGLVYVFSAFWLCVAAYAAYRKPESDRRVDAYLMRNQNLDHSFVSRRDD